MKPRPISASYLLLFLLLLRVSLHAQTSNIQRVWAVDDGERIKKTTTNHPLATSSNNKVWNGTSISLFGARNEFVAFQLILQAKSSAAVNVNVVFSGLTKSTSPGFTISNSGWNGQPYNYLGRHIEMFVMHYMNIDKRTNEDFVWWGSGRPGGTTSTPDPVWSLSEFSGLHGEQLVPFEAPSGQKSNGQGGAPFTVTANQNQAVWVDIYIPKTAPPGNYTGTIVVTEGGITRYSIPINLQVYNFALSDVNHLPHTSYLNENEFTDRHRLSAIGTAAWYDMLKRYQQFGKRHRFNIQRSDTEIGQIWSAMKESYTGTLFTPARGYYGPGEGQSPELYHIGVFSQPSKKSTRNDKGYKSGFGDIERPLFQVDADTTKWRNYWRTASNRWADSFAVYGPNTIVQKYGPEEASIEGGCDVADTSVFYDMRRKARWLRDNPGSGSNIKYVFSQNFRPEGRAMLTGVALGGTLYISPGQAGYIGNPCPNNLYPIGLVIDSVRNWRAAGINLGMYSGTRPSFGTMMIDAPAIDQRVNPWIMWKHDINGGYRHWLINAGGTSYNSWAKDYRDTGGKTWGDGTFIYAGQEKAAFSGDDRGLAGPIAGVRMKNWRRGMQDYEYLWLAQQQGLDVTGIVTSIVNKCGDQLSQYQPVPLDGWAQRGYQFENARRQLAEMIENTSSPLPYGTFSVTPAMLSNGPGNVTLNWSSVNAASAAIDQGIGSVSTNGSRIVFVDTTKTFTITLTNGQGSRQYAVAVTVRRLPSGSLNAIPDTIEVAGGQSILSWTSTDALSAVLDNGIGAVPLSGSQPVAIQQTTSYTLTLSNSDGEQSYTKTVLLRTVPSGTFQILPDSIPFDGGEVELTWTSANALEARLDHGIGNVPLNSSLTLFTASNSIYTLTLLSPFGVATYTVNVYRRPETQRFVSIPPESLAAKDPVQGRIIKPVRRGRGLFPNWANLLSEVVVQGGFQPGSSESDSAGGLRIGISSMYKASESKWKPIRDSASVRSWVRLTRWNFSRNVGLTHTKIQSALEDRTGRHFATPRGLDSTGAPNVTSSRRPLLKEQTILGPKKHNNKLYAELIAIKFNIAASQLGKTPVGFGELRFVLADHPLSGRSVREIARCADSMMTYWRGRGSNEYNYLHQALSLINRAFVAPMDTVFFEEGGQLKLRGVIELGSVPFLQGSVAPPVTLEPTTDQTEDEDGFVDDDFYDEDLTPSGVKLYQNYPNPFNPSTSLSFRLRMPSLVTMKVYNLLGQEVATLANESEFGEGYHAVEFHPLGLASGVYFYRLVARDQETNEIAHTVTEKMLLLK